MGLTRHRNEGNYCKCVGKGLGENGMNKACVNGNHILQHPRDKQITTSFLFSAQLQGGGEILKYFGQRSKCIDIVRLLYIIRLWTSLLICR